jgi:hypothetical protein
VVEINASWENREKLKRHLLKVFDKELGNGVVNSAGKE